jgi:excisionase family DNA binding protein
LRLSRAFTYELVARGQLPALRFGRRIVIPRAAIERMLDGADVSVRLTRQTGRAGDLASPATPEP